MGRHDRQLKKLETLPAVRRLGLIADFTAEELEALQTLHATILESGDNLLNFCHEMTEAIHETIQARYRQRHGAAARRGKATAHCGDFYITFENDWSVDEFEVVANFHKAMLAAGHDPLTEFKRLMADWECKADE